MLRRVFNRMSGLAGLLGVSAAAVGYLPQVGPPALRFQRPASAETARFELPPLVLTNSVPASVVPDGPDPSTQVDIAEAGNPTADPSTLPSEGTPGSAPGGPSAGSLGTAPSIAVPVSGAATLTPQVLIPFFTGGSVGPVVPTVVAPVSFVPPASISGDRSRATFTTRPP